MERTIYPKITVVTPNFNQADFLEKTICSVLDQAYPNLEYIIIDGSSNDGSLDIIKKYSPQLAHWISETDKGMYDAINKGFSRSTGEVLCWINSDDVLWKNSLFEVADIFSNNMNIQWLQGYPSVINEQGDIIYQRDPVYSKYYFYLLKHELSFSFIQQESTFWRKELWEKSGGRLKTQYALAADFDLWLRFFKHEKLYCTNKQLGAFRIRKGQKSANKEQYLNEVNRSLKHNFKDLNFWDKLLIRTLLCFNKLWGKNRAGVLGQINRKLEESLIGKVKMIK